MADYPPTYRQKEIRAILPAVRAGECVCIVGLSGAGKSNLMNFLGFQVKVDSPALVFVDGNRLVQKSAAVLFRLARGALGSSENAADELLALEEAASRRLEQPPGSLCLLFDRFDALDGAELEAACNGLRALRDAHKYRLTLVIATRHPLDERSELAELFYANTIWLGPLAEADAAWSAREYAARRAYPWDEETISRLVLLSSGYPSFLRASCEAHAAGAALELEALRNHPAVQRRVQEFWNDHPSEEAIRLSGLSQHPFLKVETKPELTASEHRLLAYFQAHPGEVCEKDDLIRAVWPEEQMAAGLRDDSLAQLVRRLREKIEADASHPRKVMTVPGRGYRFVK